MLEKSNYIQEIEKNILTNFKNNKLHHGLLFVGNKDIGKFEFSKKLAQKITGNFCEIQNNPDILIIERGLNQKKELKKDIVIDDVRKVGDFVNLTSSSSKNRVIIINSADDLNKNAANAILKNLEEPSKNIFFFLINHSYDSIVDTIKSRCNSVFFKAPNYEDFCLSISSDKLEVNDSEKEFLFDITNGSSGKAVKYFNDGVFGNYKDLVETVTQKSVNRTKFIEDLIKADGDLDIIRELIFFFINRVLKKSCARSLSELFEGEEFMLSEYLKDNVVDDIFKKYDLVSDVFLKTDNLNLDKRQSLINIFNTL